MGRGAPAKPQRAVDDRLTDDRFADGETARERAMASLDESLSQMARPDYKGDVFMLIARSVSVDNHTIHSDKPLPRTKKAAAKELLDIYAELMRLAAAAPRAKDGVLLRSEIGGDLVPWTREKPKSVAEIPVFSRENLLLWKTLADQPDPPPPKPGQPRARYRPPSPPVNIPYPVLPPNRNERPLAQQDPRLRSDEQLGIADPAKPVPKWKATVYILKNPGMTFLTEAGRIQIYAAFVRMLKPREISEERARAIVGAMQLTLNVPVERQNSFENQTIGDFLSLTLEESFFQKISAFPEFADFDPRTYHQQMAREVNPQVWEMFPDFSVEERFMYVSRQLTSTFRAVGSNLIPGKIYKNGLLFVGWGKPWMTGDADDFKAVPGQTVWFSQSGQIFYVQAPDMVEAFRQGVMDAAGGVTLAWLTLAVGGMAYYAPFALAAIAEGGAAVSAAGSATYTWVSDATLSLGTRAMLGLSSAGTWLSSTAIPGALTWITVSGTGVYLYLGQNWQSVTALVMATINLGQKIQDQGFENFFRNMNPFDVGWKNAGFNIITNLYDFFDFYQTHLNNKQTYNPSTTDDESSPTPRPSLPGASADDETHMPGTPKPTGMDDDGQPSMPGTGPKGQTLQTEHDQPAAKPPAAKTASPDADDTPTAKPAAKTTSADDPALTGKPKQDQKGVQVPMIPRKSANDNDMVDAKTAARNAQSLEQETQEAVNQVAAIHMAEDEAAELQVGQAVAAASGTKSAGTGQKGKMTSTANKGAGSRGVPSGSGAGGQPALKPLKPIGLLPRIAAKFGFQRSRFIVQAATIYREEMRRLRYIPNIAQRSSLAHLETQKRMKALYPQTAYSEEATGVSGPVSAKGDIKQRRGDITRVEKKANPADDPRTLVLELKAKAYVVKGQLVHSGDPDQMQAYAVLSDHLGVPVVIIGSDGRIFSQKADGTGWMKIGGPSD